MCYEYIFYYDTRLMTFICITNFKSSYNSLVSPSYSVTSNYTIELKKSVQRELLFCKKQI